MLKIDMVVVGAGPTGLMLTAEPRLAGVRSMRGQAVERPGTRHP